MERARGLRRIDWSYIASAGLGVLAVVEASLRSSHPGSTLSVALLLGVGATVPLAFARSAPWAAAIVIVGANLLLLLTPQRFTGAGLAAFLAIAVMLGQARYRRVRAAAAERAVARQTVVDTLFEHAARGERARIARELHDIVAHHISMISVQAETARLTTPGMPRAGAERLLAIGDTARTALTEMRRLLGVLREDAGPETTRRPQPGLHLLNELVDEARESAGSRVRLIVRGCVGPLDPGVELVAYRIVQEALTNSRRHAPGAAVDVELRYSEDALDVSIRDNGPGPADAGASRRPWVDRHGLVGMRERAATVGGELWTGRGPLNGFVVRARLPATSLAPASLTG